MSCEGFGRLDAGYGKKNNFWAKTVRPQWKEVYVYVRDIVSRFWLMVTVPLEKEWCIDQVVILQNRKNALFSNQRLALQCSLHKFSGICSDSTLRSQNCDTVPLRNVQISPMPPKLITNFIVYCSWSSGTFQHSL